METRSDAALQAFAKVARSSSDIHLIMAEEEKADLFWSYYAQDGQRPRALARELLLEQRWPVRVDQIVNELRLATMADLEAVMLVQAEMALAEGGVNPMESDLPGFRRRCARRIRLGRIWVWREGNHLIFKVDIMANTPEAIYLEGVWVNQRERRKDYGLRCLTQLSRRLLRQTRSICVLVNENNFKAHGFYRKAGYKARGCYQSVFLQSEAQVQAT
jgi:predicted GNAT family acetyltransferase